MRDEDRFSASGHGGEVVEQIVRVRDGDGPYPLAAIEISRHAAPRASHGAAEAVQPCAGDDPDAAIGIA